jgi:regulator of cell morphogenesis and NO signaling
MTIQSDSRVGEIATEHPMATKVFHRHGIDFCCGGGRPLSEACATRGVDAGLVLEEIKKELETTSEPQKRWDQEPLDDMIDHILVTYHEPLGEELPRLEAMATKVNEVHGAAYPETVPKILNVVLGLKAELESHMAKEEQVLFPMIRAGQGAMVGGPVSVMEQEHESAGAALTNLRELTNNYEVPEWACNTWRALWHGLEALEEELHQHIHLENNILFPRALGR